MHTATTHTPHHTLSESAAQRPAPLHSRFTGFSLSVAVWLALAASAQAENTAELEEILITATHLPRSQEQIAGTVSITGAEEMQRRLTEDLGDIARFQPGVEMQGAERGGNQGFVIRGMGGNRVLMLIDGVRSSDIYAAGPASYGKDAFETDDLKTVEIIRGPASVLHGADALGGAVILRTRDASDYVGTGNPPYFAVRGGADSTRDAWRAGFTGAVQGERTGLVAQYTRREFSETSIKGPASLNPQDGESDNWLLKTNFSLAPAHTLTLTADGTDERINTQMDTDLGASVSRSLGRDDTERRRLSLRYEGEINSILADRVDAALHWQRTRGTQYTEQTRLSYAFINPANPASFAGTQAVRESDFGFNQRTSGFNLLLSKDWAGTRNSIATVYGLSMDRTDTERPRHRCDTSLASGDTSCAIPSYPMAPPEQFPNKTFPDTRSERSGLFVQTEITFGDSGLVLIPAARYDIYRMTPKPDAMFLDHAGVDQIEAYPLRKSRDERLSTNLGLIYALTDALSVFTQYAEGFRAPSFDEANQAFVNLGHGYATVPNPALRPETSRGLEAGLRGNHSNIAWTLAVFNNDYSDFIETQFLGMENGIGLYQADNIGRVRIYGAEAELRWRLTETLRLRGAAAWSRGENRVSDTALDSVSPVNAVIGLQYQPQDQRWGMEGIATLVAAQNHVSAPDRVKGEAYELFDLTAFYDLGASTTLRAGVFNLFDQTYTPWASIRGLPANATDTLARATAPGRSFRVSFNHGF